MLVFSRYPRHTTTSLNVLQEINGKNNSMISTSMTLAMLESLEPGLRPAKFTPINLNYHELKKGKKFK